MSGRRALAALGAGLLAALLVLRIPLGELRRRIEVVARYAAREPAVRRLGGSSADFDRPYFILLEWARRVLPPGTPGVAVFPERKIPGKGTYLTIYALAPVPAAVAPDPIPDGWLVLAQGVRRPPGARVIAETEGGALLAPPH